MEFTVYILRTSANTLYIGQTSNLVRRLKEHNSKNGRGAKYTRCFESCSLVYSEIYPSRSEAMKREFELKKLTRLKKEELIKTKSKD